MAYPRFPDKTRLAMPDRHDGVATVALVLSLVALVISALTWWRDTNPITWSEVGLFLLIVLLGAAVAVVAVVAGVWAMGTVPPRSGRALSAVLIGALALGSSGVMLFAWTLNIVFAGLGMQPA